MGFDIYGLNPKQNTEIPTILNVDKPSWELEESERELYWEAQGKYEDENPGIYFRANVWGWRPIWSFVCGACDDIMSDKDIEAGYTNSGDKVSATKSKRMAARLRQLDKEGIIQKWEDDMMVHYNKAKKHNEKIQEKIDAHNEEMKKKYGKDVAPKDYNEKDKWKWEELYHQQDWTAHYPPSRDSIMRFARFCEESGGFEVC